jgi:hypothetical protein
MRDDPAICYILDDENRPVRADGFIRWAQWMERRGDRCRVGLDVVDSAKISTVYLGLDHRHRGKGPPLLFETMIFGGQLDQECWRYSSWDDALTGHAAAVRRVKEANDQDHVRAENQGHG